MAGTNPLPDRLRALCEYAAERVGGGIATVYLRSGDDSGLRLAATSLEGGGFGGEYRIVEGQGIDGKVARTRRPALLHADDGSLAYACVPLLAGDALVGILSLQTGGTPPKGRAAEETLLELGAALAEGIAQSEREARIAVRANRVSAINETGIRMLSSVELTEVVRLATSSIAMILDADHTILRLQDEKTRRYVIRSYFGAADGALQERLFKLDKEVCVDVIRRRTPFRVPDIASDPMFGAIGAGFRSFLSAPLKRDGRVIGTLTAYDKVATDRFYASAFEVEDLQIFTKFLGYVERAIDGALRHGQSRQHRNFDGETGLPNAGYLGRRIHEEISRAAGRLGTLALVVCQVDNQREIAQRAGPAHAHRVIQRVADALRAHLRDFDVLGRTNAAEFTILLPEPGASAGERVLQLARSVADEVAKDEALNDPVRVTLAFGYAVHPEDGRDREALLSRASEPRIRMV
jgi:diguanylate cyclase (GGDEF)-like protein